MHTDKGNILLLQAQKMETFGLMARGIAHNFDTILDVIIRYCSLTQMNMSEDDPQRGNLNNITAAADRGANLSRSLLDFGRMRPINPQHVDIRTIILQVQDFLKTVIGEKIILETDFRGEALQVIADSGQLEQVVINLATNARNAMPEGGTLSIRTEAVDIDHEFIRINGFGEPQRYALISVTDNGTGMDRETLRKIFEPFFTTGITRNHARKTGLGLSIVYSIIKQHNGFIDVSSKMDNGTTFRVYLPLSGGAFLPEAGEKNVCTVNTTEHVQYTGRQFMKNRDEYVIRMQAKLAEWGTEINMLIARGDGIATELIAEYNEQIDILKAKQAGTRKKIEELQCAGDGSWDDLKSGIEVAGFAMSEAIDSARSRFR